MSVGTFVFQVGFGKVSPINTIWVGGLNGLNDQQIERHFSRYGRVTRVVVNRAREQALVSFDSVESASIAQGEMKGRSMFGRRVRVRIIIIIIFIEETFSQTWFSKRTSEIKIKKRLYLHTNS